jgi:hypothetical protein
MQLYAHVLGSKQPRVRTCTRTHFSVSDAPVTLLVPCLCPCSFPQLWNLPWWHCSSGSCVDEGTNEIEYMEKVITTLQAKYQIDNNKVCLILGLMTPLTLPPKRRQYRLGSAAHTQAASSRARQQGYLQAVGSSSSSSSFPGSFPAGCHIQTWSLTLSAPSCPALPCPARPGSPPACSSGCLAPLQAA